jgi:RimJ/RimL family protein N-acetyltransferase
VASLRPDRARVTLGAVTPQSIDTTWAWLQDPELRAQIDSTGGPPTEAENRRYWERRLRDPRERVFTIFCDGEHVGNCGLIVNDERRSAELWAYLGTARGAGVGTAAVEQLLDLAFGSLALNRVFLRVLTSNPRAVRFWRDCRFVEEGRAREETWIAGKSVGSIWFSMLRREWPAR